MRSLTFQNTKYMRFCLYQWKWGTGFIFTLKIKKKMESILIFLSFFIKLLCQSKESPLSKNSLLYSNPFLSRKKYFNPTLHNVTTSQLYTKSVPPLYRGSGMGVGEVKLKSMPSHWGSGNPRLFPTNRTMFKLWFSHKKIKLAGKEYTR